jgi:hypothetical protein
MNRRDLAELLKQLPEEIAESIQTAIDTSELVNSETITNAQFQKLLDDANSGFEIDESEEDEGPPSDDFEGMSVDELHEAEEKGNLDEGEMDEIMSGRDDDEVPDEAHVKAMKEGEAKGLLDEEDEKIINLTEEEIFEAIDNMSKEGKAAFLARFKPSDAGMNATMADMHPQVAATKVHEGLQDPETGYFMHKKPEGGNALAKLISGFKV